MRVLHISANKNSPKMASTGITVVAKTALIFKISTEKQLLFWRVNAIRNDKQLNRLQIVVLPKLNLFHTSQEDIY